MVLAHSLRDRRTRKQLAVLVTMNALKLSTIDELKVNLSSDSGPAVTDERSQRIYDYLIPVDQIVNKSPANLYLMHRPDLATTFTKIALWRQTQFQKIVYLDADMVALRAPDELFDQEPAFAAVSDIGWPDCFNSGLLVLSPNMGDYYGLLALAQRGISFDGADQGLLNMHFRNWHRLSFTYNCTPSGSYQYVPAYRHFQSSISMVHYIGNNKPWRVGRKWNGAAGVYEELTGQWWAVYDKYYRVPTVAFVSGQSQPGSRTVQQYVNGEASTSDFFGFASISGSSADSNRKPEALSNTTEKPLTEKKERAEGIPQGEMAPVSTSHQRRFSIDWDPLRFPPPSNSRPEAPNFPSEMYHMSSDRTLFQPPASYPDPPKNMHYQVPSSPRSNGRPKPIFPWEHNQAKPIRVYPGDRRPSSSPRSGSTPSITTDADTQAETASPSTPTIQVTPAEPWASFSHTNAWDEMPEIARYIANLPQNRRRNQPQVPLRKNGTAQSPSTASPPPGPQQRRSSLILTDFPTEFERPSLPVTPAAVRRPSFWGQERDEAGDLPQAEGVPDQSQWDPMAKLVELQRQQSEMLAAGPPSPKRDIPNRALPDHSAPLPSEESKAIPTATAPHSATPKVEVTNPAQATNAAEKLGEERVVSPTGA
ncbi:MAG: hypothetical protein LQ343_000543 [Gyalolechia ehrenbergii]|nr:MAG: hypothetical protein LQ343_000543 [Gyalolechia ehrenbergii]